MRWIFVVSAGVALVTFKLGSLSVWVTVLSAVLKWILILVASTLVVAAASTLWRRWRSSK
jgi:hypothetical protein